MCGSSVPSLLQPDRDRTFQACLVCTLGLECKAGMSCGSLGVDGWHTGIATEGRQTLHCSVRLQHLLFPIQCAVHAAQPLPVGELTFHTTETRGILCCFVAGDQTWTSHMCACSTTELQQHRRNMPGVLPEGGSTQPSPNQ